MDYDHSIAILIALKNGEKVEWRVETTSPLCEWYNVPQQHRPNFARFQYRIAPKPLPKVMMRVFVGDILETFFQNLNEEEDYIWNIFPNKDKKELTPWFEAPPEIQALQDKNYAATR